MGYRHRGYRKPPESRGQYLRHDDTSCSQVHVAPWRPNALMTNRRPVWFLDVFLFKTVLRPVGIQGFS